MKTLIYVEHTVDEPTDSSNCRKALVDTYKIHDNFELEALLTKGDVREKNPSSMLSIKYWADSYKGLKEGSWYEIPMGYFEDALYEPVETNQAGGVFMRARLTIPESNVMNFTKALSSPRIANIPESPDVNLNPNADKMELIVVDCGQGNWNEVISKYDRIIYDVGASRKYNSSEVRKLVVSRSLNTENRTIHIIISHWDVDHYQALLEFRSNDFSKVKGVIVPDNTPDTATYKRVETLLSLSGIKTIAIKHQKNPPGSREITLQPDMTIGPYHFYRATPGRSRNQTGIVLCVDGKKKFAILTGDHHYEKVFNAIQSNYSTKQHCILVAPHHGGYAGDLNVSNWQSQFNCFDTPISVGANSFKHPLPDIVKNLQILQNGIPPCETSKCGTRRYQL